MDESNSRNRFFKAKTKACSPYKLDNKELMNFINDNPGAFLSEIAEGFNVTQACISITLKKLNITQKKDCTISRAMRQQTIPVSIEN